MDTQFFDAFLRADMRRQHQIKIGELSRELASVGSTCGDCDRWMKSSECPAEKNVNGMSRGPSSGARICPSFTIADSAIRHKARLAEQIAKLKEKVA